MEKRQTKISKQAKPLKELVIEFQRQFNPYYQGTKTPEKVDSKSMTVPNMALTPRELTENYVRGIMNPVKNYGEDAGYYDMEIPRFDDLNDIKEYKEGLIQKQKDIEDAIKRAKEGKERAKEEKERTKEEKEKATPDILDKPGKTAPDNNDV